MGTHRKTWSKSEKLEIISLAKKEGVLKASRQYDVSQPSIYKWMDLLEINGETSLEGLHSPELRRENKKLPTENKPPKEPNAEKEFKIRTPEQLFTKK